MEEIETCHLCEIEAELEDDRISPRDALDAAWLVGWEEGHRNEREGMRVDPAPVTWGPLADLLREAIKILDDNTWESDHAIDCDRPDVFGDWERRVREALK